MIKVNFNYGLKLILCPLCSKKNDTQEHMLECEKLVEHSKSHEYAKIFSSSKQNIIEAANECKRLYRKREKLLSRKQPCAQDSSTVLVL